MLCQPLPYSEVNQLYVSRSTIVDLPPTAHPSSSGIGSFVETWMNLELSHRMKQVRKRKKTLYSKTCMWNLEKWHGWTYLQGRNREADPRTDMWTQGGGARWDELGAWDWRLSIVTWKTELVGTCCEVQGVQLYPWIQYFFMCYVENSRGKQYSNIQDA